MKHYDLFCSIVLPVCWKSDTEKTVTFQDVNGVKSTIQVINYTQIRSNPGGKESV